MRKLLDETINKYIESLQGEPGQTYIEDKHVISGNDGTLIIRKLKEDLEDKLYGRD